MSILPSFLKDYAGGLFLAVLLAAAGFASGWKINGWRLESAMSAERLALSDARLAAEQSARETEQAWNTKYQNAIRSHHENVKQLEADLARARLIAWQILYYLVLALSKVAWAHYKLGLWLWQRGLEINEAVQNRVDAAEVALTLAERLADETNDKGEGA